MPSYDLHRPVVSLSSHNLIMTGSGDKMSGDGSGEGVPVEVPKDIGDPAVRVEEDPLSPPSELLERPSPSGDIHIGEDDPGSLLLSCLEPSPRAESFPVRSRARAGRPRASAAASGRSPSPPVMTTVAPISRCNRAAGMRHPRTWPTT